MDGLFDAREVPLAEGPQHPILADADQGLLRDDVAVAAATAAIGHVVPRRVRACHLPAMGSLVAEMCATREVASYLVRGDQRDPRALAFYE